MSIRFLLLLALSALLAGCLKQREVYVLNPDGSGKVYFEARISTASLEFYRRVSGAPDPDTPADEAVTGPADQPVQPKSSPEGMRRIMTLVVLEKSKGVEAWRDIEVTALEEGRILFRGTAYFRDIGRLNLSSGLIETRFLSPSLSVNDDGQLVLRVEPSRGIGDFPVPDQFTEQQLEDRVQDAKAQMEKDFEFYSRMVSALKVSLLFQLPGPIVHTNLETDPDGRLITTFDGKRIVQLWRRLIGDDAWIADQILAGRNPAKNGDIYSDPANSEEVLGSTPPLEAVVAPEGPQFDYDAEIAEALAYQTALLEDLRLGPAAELADLPMVSDLRVAGLQVVYESHEKGGLKPFNSRGRGLSLALVGNLPDAAIFAKVDDLGVAISEAGVDLWPDRFRSSSASARLGAPGRRDVMVQLNLDLPFPEPKEIARLSGKLTYVVALTTRTLRIPLAILKDETIEKEYIQSFRIERRSNEQRIRVKIVTALQPYQVKSLGFIDEDSQALKSRGSSFNRSKTTTLTYFFDTPLPDDAELVFEIYDPVEERQALFEIEHIALPAP